MPGHDPRRRLGGGIGPEGGVAYDADGSFIETLDEFYDDPFWRMYDDEGNVRVTDTREDCAAAANPNVGDEYANFCVECHTSGPRRRSPT